MLTTCWSAKGGSGTTAVVASLAVLAAQAGSAPLVLDLGGDVPAALGHGDPEGPEVSDWLTSPDDVEPAALLRLVHGLGGIDLLAYHPADGAAVPHHRAALLVDWLTSLDRTVLVDAGSAPSPLSAALIDGAHRSLLVTRLCYLSIRRAIASPRAASGVVLVRDLKRSLSERDLEVALDLPIVARLEVREEMARAIDAGTLQHRMPAYVRWALRSAL